MHFGVSKREKSWGSRKRGRGNCSEETTRCNFLLILLDLKRLMHFSGIFPGGQKCTHALLCHKSRKKVKAVSLLFFTILTSSILAKLLMYRLTTMMVAASVPFRPEGRMRLS